MPWSASEGKEWAKSIITGLRPASILDVGVGSGTYYDLLHDALPDTMFMGVEVHQPYVERFDLKQKYSVLYVTDVRGMDSFHADLVIFGDVLEHMPVEEAQGLVLKAKQSPDVKAILVAAPIIVFEQGACEGNEHEAHLHHFTFDELADMVKPVTTWRGEVVGYFLWTRS